MLLIQPTHNSLVCNSSPQCKLQIYDMPHPEKKDPKNKGYGQQSYSLLCQYFFQNKVDAKQ